MAAFSERPNQAGSADPGSGIAAPGEAATGLAATPAAGGASTVDTPWSVSTLSNKIKGWIDRLGSVWVEGELTQWGVSGGNVYGKLKDLDVDATVSFTIWSSVKAKIPADLKQGDTVIALVKPNYWIKGGTLTMQVFEMRHVGLGDVLERLEKLRKKLAAEGLFDVDRKKPLPFLPGCIGLVTGKDSDAEKDVLRNAQLRWPAVKFRISYAAVQGDRAVGEVIAGIRELDADPEVDVIIVARGGGDFQNLLVFSDEALVRAAAECVTPLISAIGHEADRPLLDEVADLRASTPTDAAKRVVPDVADELARVQQARGRIGLSSPATWVEALNLSNAFSSAPSLALPSSPANCGRSPRSAPWPAVTQSPNYRTATRCGMLRKPPPAPGLCSPSPTAKFTRPSTKAWHQPSGPHSAPPHQRAR